MKRGLIIGVVIAVLLIIGVSVFFIINYSGEPQKIKVNSLEITNVYRNCEKNSIENYVDTTIQTTINIDVTKNKRYSLKLGTDIDDCTLRIGPNNIEGFSINKIPVELNKIGIEESGLYMITGGELRGDYSDVLTFCCQDKCDTINLELCN